MHNFPDNQQFITPEFLNNVENIINIAQLIDEKEALYYQAQLKIESSKQTVTDLQHNLDEYKKSCEARFATINNQVGKDFYEIFIGYNKHITAMSNKIKIAKDNLESEEKNLPVMHHDLMVSIIEKSNEISKNKISLVDQLTEISDPYDLDRIKYLTLKMLGKEYGTSVKMMHDILESIFNEFIVESIHQELTNVKKISFSDAALEAIKDFAAKTTTSLYTAKADFAAKITTPLYTSLVAAKDNIVEYLSR